MPIFEALSNTANNITRAGEQLTAIKEGDKNRAVEQNKLQLQARQVQMQEMQLGEQLRQAQEARSLKEGMGKASQGGIQGIVEYLNSQGYAEKAAELTRAYTDIKNVTAQTEKTMFETNSAIEDRAVNNAFSTLVATPQITINQVEQGIKPGDRITVPGWTSNENYIFNVDLQRLNNGIYLPYKVQSINEAYTITNGSLSRLKEGDLTLDGDFLKVTNDQLLNSTISLSLEVVKRFYVVSLEKELRYQKYLNLAQKLWAIGNGTGEISSDETNDYTTLNSYLSNQQAMKMDQVKYPQVQNRDGKLIDTSKKQIYRMPPQLRLKRENLYFSNINLTNKESNGNTAITDPRVTEMNDFLGD